MLTLDSIPCDVDSRPRPRPLRPRAMPGPADDKGIRAGTEKAWGLRWCRSSCFVVVLVGKASHPEPGPLSRAHADAGHGHGDVSAEGYELGHPEEEGGTGGGGDVRGGEGAGRTEGGIRLAFEFRYREGLPE